MNYFERKLEIKKREKIVAESELSIFEFLKKCGFTNNDSERLAKHSTEKESAILAALKEDEKKTFIFLVSVIRSKNVEIRKLNEGK